jgi:hypothetical protein
MTFQLLALLAAMVTGTPATGSANTYSTLPDTFAQGLVTWAMRHIHQPMSQCGADWDGYAPTVEEAYVFGNACGIANAANLNPMQLQMLLKNLPDDCYPPPPPGQQCGTPGSVNVIRIVRRF